MRNCINCGHTLKESDIFCSRCGTKNESDIPEIIPSEQRDYASLERMAKSIIKEISDGIYLETEDNAHYIYEEVMKTFYGKNIFRWMNSNTN